MTTKTMTTNDWLVDMVGLPAGFYCHHLAVITPDLTYAFLFHFISLCATGMVIIVNFDKFLEKIKKYLNQFISAFKKKPKKK